MKKIWGLKKSSVEKKEEPDIAGFMIRIQGQLASLEKKMDDWIGRISGTSAKAGAQTPFVTSVVPAHRPSGVPQGRGRRERALHKAVCAECLKDCEIPFKPSGERPVYCKACFSKRKSDGSAKLPIDPPQGAGSQKGTGPSAEQNRQVMVTKKGVGKVTVSEIVRPLAHDISKKGNSPKPAERSRR